jgi:hypothetical protein
MGCIGADKLFGSGFVVPGFIANISSIVRKDGMDWEAANARSIAYISGCEDYVAGTFFNNFIKSLNPEPVKLNGSERLIMPDITVRIRQRSRGIIR